MILKITVTNISGGGGDYSLQIKAIPPLNLETIAEQIEDDISYDGDWNHVVNAIRGIKRMNDLTNNSELYINCSEEWFVKIEVDYVVGIDVDDFKNLVRKN